MSVCHPSQGAGESGCMISMHCYIVLTNNLSRGGCSFFLVFQMLLALLAFGSSLWQALAATLVRVFALPLFLCTLRCSHSGGTHKAKDLLGSSFLPQNYAFIPNACSPPDPQCARLSFSSDLPQYAWPLTSNRSWTPSGSSIVPVCDCFVKLLVICTVMQPT